MRTIFTVSLTLIRPSFLTLIQNILGSQVHIRICFGLSWPCADQSSYELLYLFTFSQPRMLFSYQRMPLLCPAPEGCIWWWDEKQKIQGSHSIWWHFYQMPKAWSHTTALQDQDDYGVTYVVTPVSQSPSCPLTFPRGSYKLSEKPKPKHDSALHLLGTATTLLIELSLYTNRSMLIDQIF